MALDNSATGNAARRADASAYRINTRSLGAGIEPFEIEFSGSGGEYFRVWIVNVLLTIVTLGFYTPFARRRTAQYFYGNTRIDGSPLEFTAQQRKMVFGFLLLVAMYMIFKLAADTGQDAAVSILMLAGAVLAPYFWASAMRFRLAATRWRGVRLRFGASWGEVYRASWPVFAVALAWIVVTMVFATYAVATPPRKGAPFNPVAGVPWWAWLVVVGAIVASLLCIVRLEFNYKSLQVSRAYIGAQAGRWKPVYRDFLRIWLATFGVFVGGALVLGLVMAAVVGGTFMAGGVNRQPGPALFLAIVAAILGFLVGLLIVTAPARAYRQARMFQLVWNNVGVSQIARFKCDLRTRNFVLLRLKNMLLTLLTLGFYRPFALVSEYRMKAHSVTLHVKGGLDQLVGELVQQQDGIGDAVADAVGLDLVG